MFPDLYWDWYDEWRRLGAWMSDIMHRFAHNRTHSGWQATGAIKGTAMPEDGERPEEKPRPPAGGQSYPPSKPELVPILAALSSIAIHRYEREEQLEGAAAPMG